ncbi:enoyl-CoA hydratase [Flaviaesturariibacter flavus]|uniref:Enoyl-CoA hydratase n=1 Tax=Flaviaesturariibacter flavus TaxID=2502780 RepID=A0A4V2NVF5_9BACT|nr:enoyl-CoA hydratase-related protein [Flaviaesturariibacter flavus]TCJ13276.1 enoyl-CoA hydratase [Flaviaesturariibacter flavus]
MYQTLVTQLEAGVLAVTINRPEKLNALNKEVMDDLFSVVTEIETNPEIKSAYITGAGPKSFVAGADISEFVGLSQQEAAELARRGQNVFSRIERCSKPIVAAVNGFALGGGCELSMSCHFRLAAENARFGQPEVNLGIIPAYGGTQRLVQLVGKGRALELILTGNMIDAQTALQWGLVNHVVPQDELLAKTRSLLELIGTKAPLAVGHCIKAANAVYDETQNGFETEVSSFAACFGTEDMREGTSAFLEKRKAQFAGK